MMNQNYIQYMLFNRARKRAIQRRLLLESKIAIIRQAIDIGINVAEDPKYKSDYFMLIGEFGEGIFRFEDRAGGLIKEEDNR